MTTSVEPSTIRVDDVDEVEQERGDPVNLVHGSLSDRRSWGTQLGMFGDRYSPVLGQPPLLPWLERVAGDQDVCQAFMATAFVPAGETFTRGGTEAGMHPFDYGFIGAGVFDRVPDEVRASTRDNAASLRAETATPREHWFSPRLPEDVTALHTPTLLVRGEVSPGDVRADRGRTRGRPRTRSE